MTRHFNKTDISTFRAFCIAASMVVLAGCRDETNTDERIGNGLRFSPRPSVALRVVVVNEAGLAEAVRRLRGEWAERFGGQLEVTLKTWDEVAAQPSLEADVVAYPARYLGELCTRGWLRPVRSNVWESDELRSSDFFPLVRQDLIEWAGEPMALPLGLDPVAVGENGPPLGALGLIAAAAPQAASKERMGLLFDTETMKPRIAEEPFVAALQRLLSGDEAFVEGSADHEANLPVLGYGDRLMSVTASSRNAATAFKLLEWLAMPDTSSQIARVAGGMLPVRQSLSSNSAWFTSETPADRRAELGELLDAMLSGRAYLMIPRIPGIDEYLAALDEVIEAARGKAESPKAVLEEAAERWESITEKRGRDAQREAYLKHLGIAGS